MKVDCINKAYCTFLLLFLFQASSFAQPKPLQPGDTLPANILASVTAALNPHPTPRIPSPASRIPPTASRLILLDFWATWCGSCLKKFPLLDSLQQQFGAQLKVILVNSRSTGDDADKIIAFFTKRKNSNGRPFQFPLLIADTVLKNYFPHTILPHYVWIHKNIFIAATGPAEITAANISAVISGLPVSLQTKNDSLRRPLPKQPPAN